MTPPRPSFASALGAAFALVGEATGGCVDDAAFQASLLLTVAGEGGGDVRVDVVTERADAATVVSGELTEVVHARFAGTGTFPARVTAESDAEKDRLRLRVWRDEDGDGDLEACEPGGVQRVAWPHVAGYVPVWVLTTDLALGGAAPQDPTPCDADGDGALEDVDCDDGDAEVHPGATEWCDGVDEDCDGAVDEDTADAAWHTLDADGDGAGAKGGPTMRLCEGGPGWAPGVGVDCDDHDPGVHPDASETCDGVDQDCDGFVDEAAVDAPHWYLDQDQDGYGTTFGQVEDCDPVAWRVGSAGDCDDGDPAVSPAATEQCDGIDQDCDGAVDDGLPSATWYRDQDRDGWGRTVAKEVACAAPDGYVAASGDCDDDDGGVHPGAEEGCDGVDQDCDGVVDDGHEVLDWYVDGDGDGYGDPATALAACATPDGLVPGAGDCDDDDPAAHPGATEWCDGADHDCDGEAYDPDSADVRASFRDEDGDGWGVAGALLVACSPPSGYAERPGDCDDADASAHPGATETVPDGVDQDCDGRVDVVPCLAEPAPLPLLEGAVLVGGVHGDALGASPDLTGDGIPDLVHADREADLWSGEVVLRTDVLSGTEIADVGADATAVVYGPLVFDEFGARFEAGSDLDADGNPDLVVATDGTWAFEDGTWPRTPIVVLFGPVAGSGGTLGAASGPDHAVVDVWGDRTSYGSTFGWPFAVADFDGDGHADLVVGDPRADDSGDDAGALHVVFGPIAAGEHGAAGDAPDLRVRDVLGTAPDAYFGDGVAAIGDADGDGSTDLVAGGRSGAWIACGQVDSGPEPPPIALLAVAVGSVEDVAAGDLDGDGAPDVVGWDGDGVAVWMGVRCGEARDAPDAVTAFPWDSVEPSSGVTGAAVADLDGDGCDDLVVGSGSRDGGTDVAEVTVWFGAPSLPPALYPDAAGRRYVQDGVVDPEPFAGDLDGDGLPELGVRVEAGGGSAWTFASSSGLVIHDFDRSGCGGAP